MRSSNVWTTKPWQRGEWRLGFNSVYMFIHVYIVYVWYLSSSLHITAVKTALYWGDNHIQTFDDRRYDFYTPPDSPCNYVLVKHQAISGEDFIVQKDEGEIIIEIKSEVGCLLSLTLKRLGGA